MTALSCDYSYDIEITSEITGRAPVPELIVGVRQEGKQPPIEGHFLCPAQTKTRQMQDNGKNCTFKGSFKRLKRRISEYIYEMQIDRGKKRLTCCMMNVPLNFL